jgi:hypothetical protein
MKTIKLLTLPFTLIAAAVPFGGCAEDGLPDKRDPDDRVVSVGEPGSEVAISESDRAKEELASTSLSPSSESWTKTCDAAEYYFDRNGHLYRLAAHCRTRSGSWRWSTYNEPLSCNADLANCDGYLHCGAC